MTYQTLFFDLDGTLYPPANGLLKAINHRIRSYLIEEMQFSAGQALDLQEKYFHQYGTTLVGLRNHHQINTDHYLAYVHELPLEKYLSPDPALRKLITSLHQPKWIFTNSSKPYAQKVITILGVDDQFQGIIDSTRVDHQTKPAPQAYQQAMEIAGVRDPAHCVLFDDHMENLNPAQELGMFTVLISPDSMPSRADLQMNQLHDLPLRFPQLWNGAHPQDQPASG